MNECSINGKIKQKIAYVFKRGISSHTHIIIIFLNPSTNASHLFSGRQYSKLDYRSMLLPLYSKSGKFWKSEKSN
jgi:hypothetical protein